MRTRPADNEIEEPRLAAIHFVPRFLRLPHRVLIKLFRKPLSTSRRFVLLTTRGRVTGRPHEVLLFCSRYEAQLVVISTFGWRSDWVRNLLNDPRVTITSKGEILNSRAHVIEPEAERERYFETRAFIPPSPDLPLHALPTPIFSLVVSGLRKFVAKRPVVEISFESRRDS
jgi:deazaflavin-dependent oxidoreductase (nitroreductase family)